MPKNYGSNPQSDDPTEGPGDSTPEWARMGDESEQPDVEAEAVEAETIPVDEGGGFFDMKAVPSKDRGKAKELVKLEQRRAELKTAEKAEFKAAEFTTTKKRIAELKKELGLDY